MVLKNQCVALAVALIIGLLAATGVAVAQENSSRDGAQTGGLPSPEGLLNEKPTNAPAIVEAPDGAEYTAGELIVTYDDKGAKAKADKKGGKTKSEYGEFLGGNVEVLGFEDLKDKGLEELKAKKDQLEKSPGVRKVELDPVAKPAYTPNDPYFNNGNQYNLKAMGAQEGWDFPRALGNPEPGTNHPVRIGIVDSGYDASHPEMCDTYNPDTWFCKTGVKVVAQRDFTDGDNYARDDSTGHGTFVASVASARTGNQLGIAGASPFAQLVIAKTMHERVGSCSTLSAGINYAVSKGAKVINVSQVLNTSGNQECSLLKTAVDNAYDTGHTVVAAAGNWHLNEADECGPSIEFPAYYPKAIAVGGSDGTSAYRDACRGPEVDLAAQATGVRGAIPTYDTPAGQPPYAWWEGTSVATPQVTGLVANIISTSDVAPTQGEIRRALFENADDIAAPGKDNATGYGRPNFYRTLKAAQAY
jgi:hypothetical protein